MTRFMPEMKFAVGDRVKVGSKDFAPLAELTAEVGRAWERYCSEPDSEEAAVAMYAADEKRYAASVALPFSTAPEPGTVTRVLAGLGTYYVAMDSGRKLEALAACVVDGSCDCGACLGDRDDLSTGPTLA